MKHVTAPLSKQTGTTTSNFNSQPIRSITSLVGKISLMLLFLFAGQVGVVAQICNAPTVSDASATLPSNCTTIPTISGQSGNVFELTINPANKYTFELCFAATSAGNSQYPQAELWDGLPGNFLAGTGAATANCTTVSYIPKTPCSIANNKIYLATYSHQCISDWRDLTINVTCEGCTIECGAPSFAAANNTGCTAFAFDVPAPVVTGSCAASAVTFTESAGLTGFASANANGSVAIAANAPVGTHVITYSLTDCAGTVVSCEKQVVIEPIMACDDVVNVTLSQFCEMQITPGMLLEAECADESQYTVNILGSTNDIISAPGMYEVQIMYTPSTPNSASGTYCWGFINAEDKSGPVCTLENTQISVSCGEDPNAGDPVFTDCSTVASTNKVTIDYGNCGTFSGSNASIYNALPYIVNSNITIPALDTMGGMNAEAKDFLDAGFVIDHVTVNMWTATDGNGFSSSSCQQFIYVWRPSTVNPPLPSITVECGSAIDQTTLANLDPRYVPNYLNPLYDTDTDLTNDLEFTKVDNDGDLQFLPITDVNHAACKFTVSSGENLVAELCGNTEKYIRDFTVINWCDGSIELDDFTQVIKIEDTTAPVFTDCPTTSFANPDTLLISENPSGQCGFTGLLTPPVATDFCSSPVSYSANIYTSGGTGTGYVLVSQVQDLSNNVSLPARDYLVEYFATDACLNVSAACSVYYEIVDDITPIAICDQQTTISLTNANNGVADVCADNLDSGSYDNCGITSTMVKRMNTDDAFASCLSVDCTDVGQELMVVLRVVDAAGNSNTCMVSVEVQDKVGASIVCPSDIEVTCLESTAVEATGTVIANASSASGIDGYAFDNCNVNFVDSDIISNTVDCGSGVMQREFTAFTSNGVATCVQNITVVPDYNYFVTFPADITINDCAASANVDMVGEPVISGVTCGEIGINVEDETYVIQSGACNRIVRTYTIKNTCLDVVPSTATDGGIAVAGSDYKFQDDGDGYFRYTQNIDIVDEEKPVFANCGNRFFETFESNCTGNVNVDVSATDNCSSDLTYFWKVDFYSDGSDTDATGASNNINGVYPVGNHTAYVEARDGCGNVETCSFTISVKDVKNPTLICVDLFSAIMNGDAQSVTIWASDFIVAGSTLDNCTPSSDLVVTAALGNTAGVESSQTNIVVTCADMNRDTNGNAIATTIPVRVFVTDAAGNSDFCETNISVTDNGSNCGTSATNSSAQISGRVYNENDEDIEDVMVQVESNTMNMNPFLTETDGFFVFSDLDMHGDYAILPTKDINPANGVSTYDLILLTRHILGLEQLDSPYKVIAADVNGDGTLDINDLVEVRQMILYSIQEFTSAKSWRFIDAEYQFNNPANPLAESFPEIIDFTDLTANANANFLGVKLGDLDGDSYANRLLDVTPRSFYPTAKLIVQDQNLEVGETVNLPFSVAGMDKMSAMQFTVEFDPSNLEFVGVNAASLDVKENNFGYTMIESGILTFSWNSFSGKTVDTDASELFSLSFVAKTASTVAKEVRVTSQYTTAVAFNNDGQYNVALNIQSENGALVNNDEFVLYQNEPNPFRGNTRIGFSLPEAAQATLRIMDVSGKELRVITDNFSRGYNEINLDINALNANGVLYYQLETAKYAATNKMIVIE